MLSIITIGNLTKAIRNSVREDVDKDEARRIAEHITNFFGYSDMIIDNILEPEDRDVFYMMEDSGILMTKREETTLYDGRPWRINYWLFNKDRIHKLTKPKTKKEQKEEEQHDLYDDLPDSVFTEHANKDEKTLRPLVKEFPKPGLNTGRYLQVAQTDY